MSRGPCRNAPFAGHGDVCAVLRALRLVVLALVTLVTASVAFPARGVPTRAHPVLLLTLAAADGAVPAHGTLARPPSHRWRGSVRAVIERERIVAEILEDDVDDDEGPARAPAADALAVVTRDVVLMRKPNWPLGGDPRLVRSRAAIGRGLLRGPPAV